MKNIKHHQKNQDYILWGSKQYPYAILSFMLDIAGWVFTGYGCFME